MTQHHDSNPPAGLRLAVLPDTFGICRLGPKARIPRWIHNSPFYSLSRSPVELSIICRESDIPAKIEREGGWRAFRVVGTLDMTLIGVLASISLPLAEARIGLITVSTFDTDYLLVRAKKLDKTIDVLTRAGHRFEGPEGPDDDPRGPTSEDTAPEPAAEPHGDVDGDDDDDDEAAPRRSRSRRRRRRGGRPKDAPSADSTEDQDSTPDAAEDTVDDAADSSGSVAEADDDSQPRRRRRRRTRRGEGSDSEAPDHRNDASPSDEEPAQPEDEDDETPRRTRRRRRSRGRRNEEQEPAQDEAEAQAEADEPDTEASEDDEAPRTRRRRRTRRRGADDAEADEAQADEAQAQAEAVEQTEEMSAGEPAGIAAVGAPFPGNETPPIPPPMAGLPPLPTSWPPLYAPDDDEEHPEAERAAGAQAVSLPGAEVTEELDPEELRRQAAAVQPDPRGLVTEEVDVASLVEEGLDLQSLVRRGPDAAETTSETGEAEPNQARPADEAEPADDADPVADGLFTGAIPQNPVETTEDSFESLGISPGLVETLQGIGFHSPTPIQASVIPIALEGGDVIGLAETGSGKTGAFVLPLAERLHHGRGLRGLILCPTREIALQTKAFLDIIGKDHALETAIIIGGVKFGPQMDALRRKPDIIVATPGRLADHLRRGNIRLNKLEELVLDEADHMLDLGFLPQIQEILESIPDSKRTLMFSATMPPAIERLAQRFLDDPYTADLRPVNRVAAGIGHRLYLVKDGDQKQCLVNLLEQEEGTTLVFARRKLDTEWLARQLQLAGLPVDRIHSDRTQSQRVRALRTFREGKIRILVATDVAARGIDVPQLSHVVNFGLPESLEDYVHRAGRTARGKAVGTVSSIGTWLDKVMIKEIERLIGHEIERCEVDGVDAYKEIRPKRNVRRRRLL